MRFVSIGRPLFFPRPFAATSEITELYFETELLSPVNPDYSP